MLKSEAQKWLNDLQRIYSQLDELYDSLHEDLNELEYTQRDVKAKIKVVAEFLVKEAKDG